jgi:hypothetical protein
MTVAPGDAPNKRCRHTLGRSRAAQRRWRGARGRERDRHVAIARDRNACRQFPNGLVRVAIWLQFVYLI